MVMRFPAKKNAGSQKHRAISRQEKMAFSTPSRVVLGLPSPSRRVCADGRSRDYYVTTKISRIDSLKQEGVMNSPLGWFEVSGHRDVTT